MAPTSTPKPSDSDKKHLTEHTQHLYPKILILETKMDSKITPNHSKEHSRSNDATLQKRPWHQSRLQDPPGPHFGPLLGHSGLIFVDTSTFNHSLETKRVPKSIQKRSNSNKQHITKITIESIPKFIDFGIQKRAQNDAKTEPGDDRAMALIFLGAKVVRRALPEAQNTRK